MKRATSYTEGLEARLRDPDFAAEYLSAAAEEGRAEGRRKRQERARQRKRQHVQHDDRPPLRVSDAQ